MKGIVFCEFITMVETIFSLETADLIMASSTLSTGGAYTTVGTYPYTEIVEMLGYLTIETGITIPVLLSTFGEYLFHKFTVKYAYHFKDVTSTYDLLSILNNKIHVDVKKLYPDAELPNFESIHRDASRMALIYRSKRPFADLAEGLIRGSIIHFKESISLNRVDFPCQQGAHTRFNLEIINNTHNG